ARRNMNRVVRRPGRLVLFLVTCAAVAALLPANARASDVPTSLELDWLTTCMTGQITLRVNGSVVGTFDIDPSSQCDCSTATEKSVTLTDPDTLWVLDTKGCNIYTVSFSGLNSPNSFDYVRVRETYSVSGTQTTCVKDAGNFQCSNHLCGAGVSILSGTSYSNTLPDGNANGIPDCREPGADADGDGVPNSSDNCPFRANADQSDRDSDGVGDVCDNCSSTPNADQAPAGGTHYSIGAACVNNPTPPTALICDCANQQYLKNSSF